MVSESVTFLLVFTTKIVSISGLDSILALVIILELRFASVLDAIVFGYLIRPILRMQEQCLKEL